MKFEWFSGGAVESTMVRPRRLRRPPPIPAIVWGRGTIMNVPHGRAAPR
jgi:hypothetical protein